MSEPRRGEVRESRDGRVYYVRGPYEEDLDPGPAGMAIRVVVPHTDVVEVEGRWTGQKYAIETSVVAGWKVVSSPSP